MNLLFAGIEFREEEAQISFLTPEMDEPETISSIPGQEHYAIPLSVCRTANGKYLYGHNAVTGKRERSAKFYDRILEKALREKGTMFRQMLLQYVKYLLLLGKNYAGEEKPVLDLTITVQEITDETAALLLYIRDSLKIEPKHFRITDFQESYFDYLYAKNRNLWKQDAVMYEFTGDKIQTMILSKKTKVVPKRGYVTTQNYHAEKSDLSDPAAKDAFFTKVLKASLNGRIASCIYLIGPGFEGNWMVESLKAFGTNKRIFVGKNLYSKGACLGAWRIAMGQNDAVVFESRYRIPVTVGVHVLSKQKQIFLPIAKAGTDWFNFEYKYELLYNGEQQLEVFKLNRTGDEVPVRTLALSGFPDCSEKARYIQLYTRALDQHRLYICIRDLGFGEIYKAHAKQWEFEIPLEEEKV